MKYFLYFIFLLKCDIRINPEILLGKNFNDFGLAIGVGDDTDIGAYTYFKTEVYCKFNLTINDISLINKLGFFVEIGKRQSIGLKYKINYKFAQISFLIRKEKYKLNFQIEFGAIKNYKDYFCEVSLGFHKNEIDKIKNKDEYLSKIKQCGEKKLKKQILHKFILNNNRFLDGGQIEITDYNGASLTTRRENINCDTFLNQYIKTFDPLFQNFSSRKLNKILDDIFIEQKKLFKETYYNAYNVCPKLNEYSAKFLTQEILDFDYQEEYSKENLLSKDDYFSYDGIQTSLVNRAIKYQKYSDNLFLLKSRTKMHANYDKHLKKILFPICTSSSRNVVGHMFMRQIEVDKASSVDIQVPTSYGYFNINESEIPIAYGSNCVLYSYFLCVFALISGDLNHGKKILLTFYKNFDMNNPQKIKSQIIEFLKNPIESKNNLKYFLKDLTSQIYYSKEKNKNFLQTLKDIFLKENL